jgi:hypothetical protein
VFDFFFKRNHLEQQVSGNAPDQSFFLPLLYNPDAGCSAIVKSAHIVFSMRFIC